MNIIIMNNMGIYNFQDCPVIIYDSDDRYITKAIITEHDKRDMSIEISDALEYIDQGSRLNVLIIQSGVAVEFSGRPRRVRSGRREIALFNERQRRPRAYTRHKINAPAVINSFITPAGQQPFSPPLEIIVENISSTGVLIKAPHGYFGLNSLLEIDVNIQGKDVILFVKVVREQGNADDTVSFGCKFIFLK